MSEAETRLISEEQKKRIAQLLAEIGAEYPQTLRTYTYNAAERLIEELEKMVIN